MFVVVFSADPIIASLFFFSDQQIGIKDNIEHIYLYPDIVIVVDCDNRFRVVPELGISDGQNPIALSFDPRRGICIKRCIDKYFVPHVGFSGFVCNVFCISEIGGKPFIFPKYPFNSKKSLVVVYISAFDIAHQGRL